MLRTAVYPGCIVVVAALASCGSGAWLGLVVLLGQSPRCIPTEGRQVAKDPKLAVCTQLTFVSEAANVGAQERSGEQSACLQRAMICFCSCAWLLMNDRGSGPPIPLPCEFWPRLHVRNAGPFVQFRTCMSVSPNWGDVSTWYCTSSWPVGATILSVRSNGPPSESRATAQVRADCCCTHCDPRGPSSR